VDTEHIKEVLRGLYIEENPYRTWAWVLTAAALLALPRATRRMGATGFLVVGGCMFLYFGLMAAFRSYMPDPVEPPKKASIAVPRHSGDRS